MKIVSVFLLSLFAISAFGQTDSLVNKANDLLQQAKMRQLSKDELKAVQALATNIQNQGFVLEEGKHDYAGSLAEIDRSLNIWYQLRDTIRRANLLKYKGYLLGHLNRFPEAKTKIDSAIYLFTAGKFPQGVAVSEYDLSRVYELQCLLDSALKYASITIPYWKTQRDTLRVLGSGNQVINLYLKMKRYDQALDMQQELIPLLSARRLYWQDSLEFYYLSSQLFKKLTQTEKQNQYQSLYDDEMKSLTAQNKMPKVRFGPYPD